MANITLEFCNIKKIIPVNDLDLDAVTNTELIEAAIQGGWIPADDWSVSYFFVSRDHTELIRETRTLSELGFCDEDIIKVVAMGLGA